MTPGPPDGDPLGYRSPGTPGGGAGKIMTQAPERIRPSGPARRPGRGPAGVPRWLHREAVECWSAVRAAERRTVVTEGLLCALVAAIGLLPLPLVPPDRLVPAVVEALWAAVLVPLRRARPGAAVLGSAVLVVGDNVWTLAVAPLIVLSAARRIAPTRRVWQSVGVACAVVGVLALARGALVRTDALLPELAGNAVSCVLLLLLPALSGTLLGQRRPWSACCGNATPTWSRPARSPPRRPGWRNAPGSLGRCTTSWDTG